MWLDKKHCVNIRNIAYSYKTENMFSEYKKRGFCRTFPYIPYTHLRGDIGTDGYSPGSGSISGFYNLWIGRTNS